MQPYSRYTRVIAVRKFWALSAVAGWTMSSIVQAQDLPAAKQAPGESLPACVVVGVGFWALPGTDTCLRVSGEVRADYSLTQARDRRADRTIFETRGQIGGYQLSLLPRGAGVLNISRGAVVDGKALAENLVSGHLSGAVLDVFETEPLPEDSFWWDVPNLIITPHTSCDDSETYVESCTEIFVANVKSILEGGTPRNVVSQELEY